MCVSCTGPEKAQLILFMLYVHAKLLQSYPTLCNSIDCSLSGSSAPGILQARIQELIAIPSSRVSSWPRDQTLVSCIADRFFTLWATGKQTHIKRAIQECHSVVYQNMTIVVEFSKFFLGGEKGEMSPEERYQMTAIVKMWFNFDLMI